MIKVLHVIRGLDRSIGGPVIGLKNLVEAQCNSGSVSPSIFSVQSGNDAAVQQYNCPVTVLKSFYAPSNLNDKFRFFNDNLRILAKLIQNHDVIHLHMTWDFPVLRAAALAVQLGRPFVLRPCGQLEKWSMEQRHFKKHNYLKYFGSNLKRASALHFTTSAEDRLSVVSHGWTGQRYTIPMGVNQVTALDDEFRNFNFCEAKSVNILFLGRLNPKKQPEKVLHSLSAIKKSSRLKFYVRFVGHVEERYLNALKALARKLEIQDFVWFLGPADNEGVLREFQRAHIFVLPSLQENLSIATVEAMASGLPVLVSDRVAIHSDISEYGAGRVISATKSEFSNEILEIFSDEYFYQKMSKNAKRLVDEKFLMVNNAHEIYSMYRSLVSG